MKRIFCLLVSFLMLASCLASFAEEAAQEACFPSTVLEWVKALDPERMDHHLRLSDGNQSVEAVLRKDPSLAEIEIPGLGRLQTSEKQIALEWNGQKIIVDLDSILSLASFAGEDGVRKDMEILKPWLRKAAAEIFLPCAELHSDRNGFSLHIEATGQNIRDRTYALIDEMMEERTTLETLLSRYGKTLALFIPHMKTDFDSLKEAWEAEKARPRVNWPAFTVNADLSLACGRSGPQFAFAGDLSIDRGFACFFRLEYAQTEEGFDLNASFDPVSPYMRGRYSTTDSYALSLTLAGRRLSGRFSAGGESYTLNAEITQEREDSALITGSLSCSGESGSSPWELRINCPVDIRQRSLRAVFDMVRYPNTSDESSERVAVLDGRLLQSGLEAALETDTNILSLRLNGTEKYARAKFENRIRGWSRSTLFDAWIFHPEEQQYRIRIDTNLAGARQQYSLFLNKGEMAFDLSYGYGKAISAKIMFRPGPNGFDAEIDYLNLLPYLDQAYTGPEPWSLKVSRNGSIITADLALRNITAHASAELSEDGQLKLFEGEATTADLRHPDRSQTWRLSYVPGTATLAAPDGIYELKVTANTSQTLVLRLTKDYQSELGSLVFTLDPASGFSGLLTVEGQEKANLSLFTAEKEPIVPITEEGALRIDLQYLEQMLAQNMH